MCGIAGLFSKSPELSDDLGAHLGEMLLQLSDRGPDSAGVAFYRDPAPAGSSKVSLYGPQGCRWDDIARELAGTELELRGSHAVLRLEMEAGPQGETAEYPPSFPQEYRRRFPWSYPIVYRAGSIVIHRVPPPVATPATHQATHQHDENRPSNAIP